MIESIAHQLAMVAYDLEAALLKIHPNLSVYAIAAFWTSWRVWRHVVDWAPRIEREMIQQKRAPVIQTDERTAVQFLHRQMWTYAQELDQQSGRDRKGSDDMPGAEQPNPLTFVDEWSVPSLSTDHRNKIKSKLLKAHAAFWRSSPDDSWALISPMRLAFDGIARVLFDAKILTAELLERGIRLLVLESAIAWSWCLRTLKRRAQKSSLDSSGMQGRGAI